MSYIYVVVNLWCAQGHHVPQAHLLDTIDDEHTAIFIEHTYIAGLHPPVFRERIRVGIWVPQISFHDVRSFDEEFTFDELGRHIRNQCSDGPSFRIAECCNADDACRLRHAIAPSDRNLRSFFDQVNEVAAQGSRATSPPVDGRQIILVDKGMLDQCIFSYGYRP